MLHEGLPIVDPERIRRRKHAWDRVELVALDQVRQSSWWYRRWLELSVSAWHLAYLYW